MDKKTEQKKRMAGLIVERGFATGFILNTNNRTLDFQFTDDGIELKKLLTRLLDMDNTNFTQDEFFYIITHFILAH